MKIERINPDNVSDEDIKQILDFSSAISRELDPIGTPPTENEIKRNLKDVDKYYPTQHFYAKSVDGIIAEMVVSYFNPSPEAKEDDLKKADIIIKVSKDERRKGVGTAVLRYALENILLPRHKEIIIGAKTHCGYEFCKALGGKQVSKAIISRYFFDKKDYSDIEKINQETKARSPHINVTIKDGYDDEIMTPYIELSADLEHEISAYAQDYVFNRELFKNEALNWIKKEEGWGIKKLFAFAHDESGILAGFSELYLDPEHPEHFATCLTGIRKEFRRMGLCKRLKTELMLHIRDNYREIKYIITDNDEENSVMRGINNQLGFIQEDPYVRYRFDVDGLKERLGL